MNTNKINTQIIILDIKIIKFVLSNIIEHKGTVYINLEIWIKECNKYIIYDYNNLNYHKQQ